jgi:transcriptional regulator with XRE-family HTH domain
MSNPERPEGLHFGALLKKIRLEEAKIGLRKFAERLGISPVLLCKIEQGYEEYPRRDSWLECVLNCLGNISEESVERLTEAFIQPFHRQRMPEYFMPVFVRKSDGSQATIEEATAIYEQMKEMAERHNALVDAESQRNEPHAAEE